MPITVRYLNWFDIFIDEGVRAEARLHPCRALQVFICALLWAECRWACVPPLSGCSCTSSHPCLLSRHLMWPVVSFRKSIDPSQKLPQPLVATWGPPIVDPFSTARTRGPSGSLRHLCHLSSMSLSHVLADSSCPPYCQSHPVRDLFACFSLAPSGPLRPIF